MQRWKKHLWTGSWLGAAVLLILAAVVVGAVRLIDIAAPQYREELAKNLSESLDLPVAIGSMGMSWQAFRPTFELEEVVILDRQRRPVFQVAHIGLPFKWGSLLQGELFPYLIELRGLAIALEWRADGSMGIRGIGTEADGGELDLSEITEYIEKLNRIEIVDGVISWSDLGEIIGFNRIEHVDASLKKVSRAIELRVDGRMPRHLGDDFHFYARIEGALSVPEELMINTRFTTDSLYADGWLSPVLRDTAALRGGTVKVDLTSNWRGLDFLQAAIQLTASPMQDVGTGQARDLPGLQTELKIKPLGDGWDMAISSLQYGYADDKSPVSRGKVRYQPTPDGFGTRLDAELDSIRVSDLVAWLSVLDVTRDVPMPSAHKVQGQLLDTWFDYYQEAGSKPRYGFSSKVQNLTLPATEYLPGITGMGGTVYATHEAGRLVMKSTKGSLEVPEVFATPMPLDHFETEIHWERKADNWEFFSQSLSLEVLTAQAQGSLKLLVDEAPSPLIDLTLDFTASDILPLKPYIPLPPVLPEEVGEWLQTSLKAGRVPKGTMKLKGRLTDFPYEEPDEEGLFRIDFRAEETVLEYVEGWPAVEGISGDAVFKGRSMHIDADKGRILGVPVSTAEARIADYLDPVLTIKGEVQADVGRQLSFLEASPLKEDYAGLLKSIAIKGPGHLDLDLAIPLDDVDAFKIIGDIDLQGIQLKYADLAAPVEDIHGFLRFSERGLEAKSLQGRFLDLPTVASLSPVTDGGNDLTRMQASTTVTLPGDAAKLAPYINRAALEMFSGKTAVHIESTFDTSASFSHIRVHSDFQGMRSNLGQPFAKQADEKKSLEVMVSPAAGYTNLKWHFDNSLHGLMRLVPEANGDYRLQTGRIRLGSPGTMNWPLTPGLRIDGSLPVLDLNKLLGAGGAASMSILPVYADASIGEFGIAGQLFRNIRLRSGRSGDVALTGSQGLMTVEGDDAKGELHWHTTDNGRRVIKGDFENLHLHVPDRDDEQDEPDAAEKDDKAEPINPAELPVVNLQVGKFRLGDEGLGSLKLNTEPIPAGMRLATMQIGGRRINVNSTGRWVRKDGQSSARLVTTIKGSDIAGLLNAAGYAPSITAEKSDVSIQLDWTPSAAGLEMERLNGSMEFKLTDGNLLAVEPGAGRVLSLLSFYSLPRRLSLDFRDVLGKGTAFDTLTGHFDVKDGNAVTDDLEVITPSARIEVRGRVGLAARDFDQKVTIYPGLGSSIALAGAVLGGPVLGIGLWIVQELLEKPMDEVTKLSYRLTGTWDDPQIKPLRAEPVSEPSGKKPQRQPTTDQPSQGGPSEPAGQQTGQDQQPEPADAP